MVNIEKLNGMSFNYIEAPNKAFLYEADQHTVIIAELSNIQVERDVCIDAKAFEMIKKLTTNRTLSIKDNTLYIKSKEGSFKTQLIEKGKPFLNETNFDYQATYDVLSLKNASNFVSSNPAKLTLNGVLFNKNGGVCATDGFKVYVDGDITNLKYSVPSKFIKLLDGLQVSLQFNDTRVCFNGDYKIIASLFNGNIPDMNSLLEPIKKENIHSLILNKSKEIYFYQTETVELNLSNKNTEFIFKDDINEFKVELPYSTTVQVNYLFSYEHIMTVLNLFDTFELFTDGNALKPVYITNRQQEVILLPMRRS